MSLGERLKELREKRGMTQVELAAEAGVTQGYIAKLEPTNRPGRAKTIQKSNPSFAVLVRLAQALGVTVSELLTEPRRPR